MAAIGPTVPCLGPKCRKMVVVEPGKSALCQLCARATLNAQAILTSKDDAAITKRIQQEHRYGNEKWRKEIRRRNDNKLRYEVRAAEADIAAAARHTPVNRVSSVLLSRVSGSGSSSRYTPASASAMQDSGVYNDLFRAASSNIPSSAAPRRIYREESVGPGYKVSKTGRVRQAGHLIAGDDDSLPTLPLESTMPSPRRLQNRIEKHKDNRQSYHDDDTLPDNPIHSMGPPPRLSRGGFDDHTHTENKDNSGTLSAKNSSVADNIRTANGNSRGFPHGMADKSIEPAMFDLLQQRRRARQARRVDSNLIDVRTDGGHRYGDKNQDRQRPRFNRYGRLIDSDEEPDPPSYQETLRNFQDRDRQRVKMSSSRPATQDQFEGAQDSDGYKVSHGKRRNRDSQLERRGKRIKFKSTIRTALNQSDTAVPDEQIWAVPKNVKAMIPQPEITADTGLKEAFSVARSESLGVPDDDSALLLSHESVSDAESESMLTQRSLPLNEKMSKWLGDDKGDEIQTKTRAQGHQTSPAAHLGVSTESKPTRFERGMLNNDQDMEALSAAEQQLETQPVRLLTDLEIETLAHHLEKVSPAVLVPRYQPSNQYISASSTASRSASVRSVAGDPELDALTLLQGLPLAMKQGTLKPTTPQKRSKHGALFKTVGVSTNRSSLQTISAQTLRMIEGLSPGSQIDDDVLLNVARRAQEGTLGDVMERKEDLQQGDEDETEILRQLLLEEFESKKKQYEEAEARLNSMAKAGENVHKQSMVVRLLGGRLDEFVKQHGLKYRRSG